MKRLVKSVVLMVLSGLLVFFVAQALFTQERKDIRPTRPPRTQDTTKTGESVQKETYVSAVVISAPWAKKNLVYDKEESPTGEFGYHVDEETAIGPSCFAVASTGDIYIADPLNNRMQRYNSQGGFISTIPMPRTIADICIDQDNNIHLYGGGSASGSCILKYDQKGKLLQTYPLHTSFSRTGGFIYCDKSGRVFYAYPWSRGGAGFYQVGTSEKAFSLEEQKKSVRSGELGFNSVALDSNFFFKPSATLQKFQRGPFFTISLEGDTLKISNPIRGGWFFGCDEEGNIYMYFWDSKASLGSIRKYDPEGDFLSTFEYRCKKPYIKLEGFGGSRTMTLDKKGNLYMFCFSDKDGIRVIKWYKETQKGGDK